MDDLPDESLQLDNEPAGGHLALDEDDDDSDWKWIGDKPKTDEEDQNNS